MHSESIMKHSESIGGTQTAHVPDEGRRQEALIVNQEALRVEAIRPPTYPLAACR